MDQQENIRLIEYYLDLLTAEHAAYLAAHIPSSWDLLTPQEQHARALLRVQKSEEERINNFFTLNTLNRENKAKRRGILAANRARRLARSK